VYVWTAVEELEACLVVRIAQHLIIIVCTVSYCRSSCTQLPYHSPISAPYHSPIPQSHITVSYHSLISQSHVSSFSQKFPAHQFLQIPKTIAQTPHRYVVYKTAKARTIHTEYLPSYRTSNTYLCTLYSTYIQVPYTLQMAQLFRQISLVS